MQHHVIFQVHTERGWLDYCREQSPSTNMNQTNIFGKDWCDRLEKREGKVFRFVVEVWN